MLPGRTAALTIGASRRRAMLPAPSPYRRPLIDIHLPHRAGAREPDSLDSRRVFCIHNAVILLQLRFNFACRGGMASARGRREVAAFGVAERAHSQGRSAAPARYQRRIIQHASGNTRPRGPASPRVAIRSKIYSSPPLRNGDSSASRRMSYSIPARSSSTKFATARRRPVCAIQCAEYVGFGK
jgi:hypothetical protein